MSVYLVPLFVLLWGLGLMLGEGQRPRYDDVTWFNRVPYFDSEAYHHARAEHLTADGRNFDFGLGLSALAIAVGLTLLLFGVRSLSDLRRAKTPKNTKPLYLAANLTWLGLFAAQAVWLWVSLKRGDYPPWADSIQIPLFQTAITMLCGWPLVNLGLYVCLRRSKLPVSLWHKPADPLGWFGTFAIGLVSALTLLSLCTEVKIGNGLMVVALWSVFVLLLCGRAAAASTNRAVPSREA